MILDDMTSHLLGQILVGGAAIGVIFGSLTWAIFLYRLTFGRRKVKSSSDSIVDTESKIAKNLVDEMHAVRSDRFGDVEIDPVRREQIARMIDARKKRHEAKKPPQTSAPFGPKITR